jgi:hypothetical protein
MRLGATQGVVVFSTQEAMLSMLAPSILYLVLSQTAGQAEPAALHATVQRDFTFLESTRTTEVEYWIGDDGIFEKRGEQVRIDRRDLGVTWLIDSRKGAYSEQRRPAPAPAATARGDAAEDMHTAGFDYEPEFIWQVKDTGERQALLGRDCRLTVATGVADFAETELRLWLCASAEGQAERQVNDLVLRQARFPFRDMGAFVAAELARRAGVLLLLAEARTDPPISRMMRHQVRVSSLETGPAPPGIFEVPKGLTKTPER